MKGITTVTKQKTLLERILEGETDGQPQEEPPLVVKTKN